MNSCNLNVVIFPYNAKINSCNLNVVRFPYNASTIPLKKKLATISAEILRIFRATSSMVQYTKISKIFYCQL